MPFTPSSLKRRKGGPRTSKPLEWKTAVLAAAAGLVGALIGGGISLIGIERQVDAAARENVAEDLRTERQAAYADFLGTSRELVMAIAWWENAILSHQDWVATSGDEDLDPRDDPEAQAQEAEGLFLELLDQRGAIELVGSVELQALTEPQIVSLAALMNHISSLAGISSDPIEGMNHEDIEEHHDASNRLFGAFEDSHSVFLEQAREDLYGETVQ